MMLLIERKTGDEPPEDEQKASAVGNTLSLTGISDISGSLGTPTDKVDLITFATTPTSPLTPGNFSDKIALGFSHFAIDPGYYLKNERLTTFPIAYKPEKEGVLLFYFGSDGNSDFDYFKEDFISIQSGTILPNYYGDIVLSNLIEKMRKIDVEPGGTYLPTGAGVFNHVIRHDILTDEKNAYTAGGNTDELRLFHLIKNNILKEDQAYYFVAALYDISTSCDEEQRRADNLILDPLISFPCSLTIKGENYHYIGMDMLEIKEGEPDDPNWLKIVDICKCNGKYLVTFELQFCNESDTPTDGATIILNDKDNLFSCCKLVDISSQQTEECLVRNQCSLGPGTCDFNFIGRQEDERYCLSFPVDNQLGLNEQEACASLIITAKMDAADIDRLIEDPVMDFCVYLHGSTSGARVCADNIVLRNSILDSQDCLIVNPIWDNKDIDCEQQSLSCNCHFDSGFLVPTLVATVVFFDRWPYGLVFLSEKS